MDEQHDSGVFELKTPFGEMKIPVGGTGTNNVVTMLTFALACLIAWTSWMHQVDAKEGSAAVAAALAVSNEKTATALKEQSKESVSALKDLTQATREQTCLMAQEKKDAAAAEFCKRLTR